MASKKRSPRRKGKEGSPAIARFSDSEPYNVFIGWSGQQSRQVASALRDWLPRVNQFSRPWMSDRDIDKGARWEQEIASQLSERRFGIICLTPDNLDSRWMLFEAGAMSRDFVNRVAPYLVGLSHADIKPPLTQFQTTTADRDDTGKLILSINRALGSPVDEGQLREGFDVWWPKLDEILKKIPPSSAPPPKRGIDEILNEILDHVREIRRTSGQAGLGVTGVTGFGNVGNVTPVRAATSAAYESLAAVERSGPVFKGLAESPLMEALRKGTADDLPLPPKKK